MSVAYYNYMRSVYELKQRRKIHRRRIRDVSNPFELEDGEFQSLWRITKLMALYIIEHLKVDLEPRHGDGFPVYLKFLANGGYQRQIGQDHTMCLAQTTVSKFLDQFLESIYVRLLSEWVHFPASEAARRQVSEEFQQKYNIPGILGVVNCTHIKNFPPPGPTGAQYKNLRKNTHTLNVQLIADSHCRIINVNARYPGRVHDAFIWRNSNVRYEVKRLCEGRIGSYFLLGDSGYPLEPWLLTPILHAAAGSPEHRYTDWHCKVRNIIERTNGYLKGSLRCLGIDRALHYCPEKASKIVYASCIIYNLMKHFGVPLIEATDAEEFHAASPEEPSTILRMARTRRQNLVNSYFQ